MKLSEITKERYLDILFNPNISVTEKRSSRKAKIIGKRINIVKLMSLSKTIAIKEVGVEGAKFYEVLS